MTHTPHELQDEFPQLAEKISQMKQSDGHFARLTEEYHVLNRAIHRAESSLEPVSDQTEREMRKKRALLKDEIYRRLTA